MPAKTMSGARGKVFISDPNNGGTPVLVGIFNSMSWGLNFEVRPVEILGRYSPDELVYVAQDAVSIQCSGFRVVDNGAHVAGRMPNLRDLLTHEYIQIVALDRQTGKEIAKFHSVRPTSYQTTLSARNLEEISISYMGLLVDDESTTNVERADASTLP